MQSLSPEFLKLGTRLAALRRQYAVAIGQPDMDAAAFAAILGLPAETYAAYEAGLADPPASALMRLHGKTGVSLEWLLTGPDVA